MTDRDERHTSLQGLFEDGVRSHRWPTTSRDAEIERIDRHSLLRAMEKAWPSHVEGSGGTDGATTSHWDVPDPALPTEALANGILEALRSQAAGDTDQPRAYVADIRQRR